MALIAFCLSCQPRFSPPNPFSFGSKIHLNSFWRESKDWKGFRAWKIQKVSSFESPVILKTFQQQHWLQSVTFKCQQVPVNGSRCKNGKCLYSSWFLLFFLYVFLPSLIVSNSFQSALIDSVVISSNCDLRFPIWSLTHIHWSHWSLWSLRSVN